jgi:HD superfamily phosphodiesterase
MNLTWTIESAETEFKQILEEFFSGVYDKNYLSSHGIDHHRRVWNYAKELFALHDIKNRIFFSWLPPKLIIACYLHDIGMSAETGTRHGKHSRELCVQFLNKNKLPESEYYDLLEAIGNHDEKDYTGSSETNEILKILSVADDLDAFGFTGIFRYSEIYLTRGINPSEIGHLIKKNATTRFNNFVKCYGFNDQLVQKHRKRYDILDKFFSEYNKQIPYYRFGGHSPSGYCGVVELFINFLKDEQEPDKLTEEQDKYPPDNVIRWFFDGFTRESI